MTVEANSKPPIHHRSRGIGERYRGSLPGSWLPGMLLRPQVQREEQPRPFHHLAILPLIVLFFRDFSFGVVPLTNDSEEPGIRQLLPRCLACARNRGSRPAPWSR